MLIVDKDRLAYVQYAFTLFSEKVIALNNSMTWEFMLFPHTYTDNPSSAITYIAVKCSPSMYRFCFIELTNTEDLQTYNHPLQHMQHILHHHINLTFDSLHKPLYFAFLLNHLELYLYTKP